MQEAKPTPAQSFYISDVIKEAARFLSDSKWPLAGSLLALMLIMCLTPLAEYILYRTLIALGGNVQAGMIVMGSAIALGGLYICFGIGAGIIKIAIERARNHPVSVVMGFEYFSRAIPLFLTFLFVSILLCIVMALSLAPQWVFDFLLSQLLHFLMRLPTILVLGLGAVLLFYGVKIRKHSPRSGKVFSIIGVIFLSVGISPGLTLVLLIALFGLCLVIVYISISALFSLSFLAAVDKINNPFTAMALSFKTLRVHWLKITLLYLLFFLLQLLVCLPSLAIGFIDNLPLNVIAALFYYIVSIIWLVPFMFFCLGIVYHKLMD